MLINFYVYRMHRSWWEIFFCRRDYIGMDIQSFARNVLAYTRMHYDTSMALAKQLF